MHNAFVRTTIIRSEGKKNEKSRTTNKVKATEKEEKWKSHQNHSDDLQQNCLTHLKICVRVLYAVKVSTQKNAQSQHKLVVSSFSTEFNTHTHQTLGERKYFVYASTV